MQTKDTLSNRLLVTDGCTLAVKVRELPTKVSLVRIVSLLGGKIAQWWSACPRAKKSVVQASATTSCCGGELFTYI